MANANLCMFVNACTYVLGLNERYVMHTYVAYVQDQNWQQQTERDTQRERQTIKHRGSYHTFFKRGQFGKIKITAYNVLIENKIKI